MDVNSAEGGLGGLGNVANQFAAEQNVKPMAPAPNKLGPEGPAGDKTRESARALTGVGGKVDVAV
jgi:hypothetical protein